MAEEKKKIRIIKQILKWLWLGLLVSLIICALILDAPWKVLALLLVLLSAHTILPKAIVKLFWLLVAAIIVILVVWIFLPDKDDGWQPFTFDEELAALQDKYAIPDSENAALLYNKLFETFDTDSNVPEFFNKEKVSSTSEPWFSKDHPETADWLKGQQKTIDTLLQISQMEKCSFPISANTITDIEHSERLSKIRKCAFLLISSANNDIAEGRIDAGLEKYLCITGMGKHLYQQPAIIDFMVGVAIESLPLTRLNRFIIEGEPTEQQLKLIANALLDLKNNWNSDFSRVLTYEKLLQKNFFAFLYEINQQGKIRFSRNPAATISTLFPQEFPPLSHRQRRRNKASIIIRWFLLPPTPQKFANIIDKTYEKYDAMTKPDFDWKKIPAEVRPQFKLNYHFFIETLIDMSAASYYTIHEIYLRNLTYRRGSRLLLAIKQYKNENGTWPPDLNSIKSLAPEEAFIDPVSGKQLVYENHGKRFSLYGETINIWPK